MAAKVRVEAHVPLHLNIVVTVKDGAEECERIHLFDGEVAVRNVLAGMSVSVHEEETQAYSAKQQKRRARQAEKRAAESRSEVEAKPE